MKVTVLLADDHAMFRDGLRSLVSKLPEMEVVADAEDGRTAVRLARKLSPSIVIMDVGMPDLNGIEATRQIAAELPQVKVIILSMHSKKSFVTEAFTAGASGYVLKDCAFEELERAVHAVLGGQTYLSPQVAGALVTDYVERRSSGDRSSTSPRLTPRESEVLQLLAEGKSTKEIAVCLHLSPKTVEMHRRKLMDKLGIDSIAILTKYAISEGLTSLEF